MLCAASLYFHKALNGKFLEAGQDTHAIPNFDATTIKRFQEWLALRKFPLAAADMEGCPNEHVCGGCIAVGGEMAGFEFFALSDEEDRQLEMLINNPNPASCTKLYHFADRYDIPLLRKHVIDYEWRLSMNDNHRGYAAMIYCWRNLPATSPYTRLLVDAFLQHWEVEADQSCHFEVLLRQKLPSELSYQLLAKCRNGQKIKKETANNEEPRAVGAGHIKDLCTYHEHDQDLANVRACSARPAIKRHWFGLR